VERFSALALVERWTFLLRFRYGVTSERLPRRSAGFQTCRVADFQIGWDLRYLRNPRSKEPEQEQE
jgi:hypothetical protein